MASDKISTESTTFFVAKAQNMNSLKDCHSKCIWACKNRSTPPQPKDLLSDALDRGPVILLYSVNNCHGWHGYAQVLSKPGSESVRCSKTENSPISNDENEMDSGEGFAEKNTQDGWQRFRIKWIKAYLDEHGEKCLSSSATDSLNLIDGSPLNNARNWQMVAPETGVKVCQMIDEDIAELSEVRKNKLADEEARRPPAFFKADERVLDAQEIWKRLTKKVEGMGQILLACAFGSQRYNLHTPSSDVDMFIVYAAPTKDVLGFNPPQHTIKNRDIDNTCDYTVHEVHRYAELLLAGDPRCVETLFLHPSSIYSADPTWQQLVLHRHLFLTRGCCEKYVRDAEGSRGLRLLQKWEKAGETDTEPMSPKVAKLYYIIIRLLQNAREVAVGTDLQVYRPETSVERELLMNIRASKHTHEHLMGQINSLQNAIQEALDERTVRGTEEPSQQCILEDWLMKLRYEDLKKFMETKT